MQVCEETMPPTIQEIGFFCAGTRPSEVVRTAAIVSGMRNESVRLFTPKPELYDEFISEHCTVVTVEGDTPPEVLAWASSSESTLLVVDGSLPIVRPAADSGCPVLLIRPHGRWEKSEHLEAFDRAHSLIAPFPKVMEQVETPEWICEKTHYYGGLLRIERLFARPSKKESVLLKAIQEGRDKGGRYVTVALHQGDADGNIDDVLDSISTAEESTVEEWNWLILGGPESEGDTFEERPGKMTILGRVTAPHSFYRLSDVVVGTADELTVVEVALSGSRFLCVPQQTRYDEQQTRGEVLKLLDVATVLDRWPLPLEWEKWLSLVSRRPATMQVTLEEGGARRAIAHVRSLLQELRSA